MNLTPKQEKFVQKYIECSNASEAYRHAYDVGENTKDEVVWNEASIVLNNHEVTIRLEEINNQIMDAEVATKLWLISQYKSQVDWYRELQELAMQDPLDKEQKQRVYMLKDLIKGSDFRGSLDSIAKMLGLDKPKDDHKEVDGTTIINIIEHKND